MSTPDWRELSREAGLVVHDDGITVRFHDERSQQVWVDDSDPAVIRIWSVAAKPAAARELGDPNLQAWQRNRLSDLVGYKTDGRGRLIGEAWAPRAGLTPDELALYVNVVARSCDRMEYLLTGRDQE
jgi:hypothetical protein